MGAVELVDDFEEVLAVLVLEHGLGETKHVVACDPALAVGDPF